MADWGLMVLTYYHFSSFRPNQGMNGRELFCGFGWWPQACRQDKVVS